MPSFSSRIGFSIPTFQLFTFVDFHRTFANSRCRSFLSSFFLRKKKSLQAQVCTREGSNPRYRLTNSRDDIHLLHRGGYENQYVPAGITRSITATGTIGATSTNYAYCHYWLFLSVPSDFIGTIADNRDYSTGTA